MIRLNRESLLLKPNAKINLGLRILRKRADGYHDIESIFYPVGWSDCIRMEETTSLVFENTGIRVDGRIADNLCVRAFLLIRKDYPHIGNVKILLHKKIPPGAGLGGGSSDAAAVLIGTDRLFSLNLTQDQLFHYSAALGSDVYFFIGNKTSLVQGKGEVMENIPFRIPFPLLLIYPGFLSSTKEAYANISCDTHSSDPPLATLLQKPVAEWKNLLTNDFEPFLFKRFPLLKNLKNKMYEHDAVYASVTGSGSCVYGIFESRKICTEAEKLFPEYQKYIHEEQKY